MTSVSLMVVTALPVGSCNNGTLLSRARKLSYFWGISSHTGLDFAILLPKARLGFGSPPPQHKPSKTSSTVKLLLKQKH